MYFPKAEVNINIAETTFVLNAISLFLENNDTSDEYEKEMIYLSDSCKALWTDDEWEVYNYMYNLNDWSKKFLVDRKAYWTISIIDCDAIILAMQFLYVTQSKKAIQGDKKAESFANSIKDTLIPRFSDMFSKREWKYYFNKTEAEAGETVEIVFDNQDTAEIVSN